MVKVDAMDIHQIMAARLLTSQAKSALGESNNLYWKGQTDQAYTLAMEGVNRLISVINIIIDSHENPTPEESTPFKTAPQEIIIQRGDNPS